MPSGGQRVALLSSAASDEDAALRPVLEYEQVGQETRRGFLQRRKTR
jgi:hypothetical protein